MISQLLFIGKYLFIGAKYVFVHRDLILYSYSYYDMTKFAFVVSDKLGFFDKIKKKNSDVIFVDKEDTDVGEFEIIII